MLPEVDSKPSPEFRIPSLVEIEAEMYKRSLSDYIKAAWHVVEPGEPYRHNWHIDLLSDYLTAATNREIRNLLINIPPRFMKSLLCSVFWPTWVWTFRPESRWLTASYAIDLATRDAVKSRRILYSWWYRERFRDVFKLTGDQNQKTRYENDKTGYRLAVGTGGATTGEGGDFILVDDPLKAQDCDSQLAIETVNDWWDNTMTTRGNNAETVCRVVIMQRLNQNDLTGHILEKMQEEGSTQYEHVCLPMRYEPKRFFSTHGREDPRKEVGELLWPERFPLSVVKEWEINLGDRNAAGQLQQRPSPAGGTVFQMEWWNGQNRYDYSIFSANPSVGRWVFFDTAFDDKDSNAYSAGLVLDLLRDYRVAVRFVEKRKLQFPQLTAFIENIATTFSYDGLLRGIVVEDKASGTSALQTIRQDAKPGLAELLMPFQPQGSKDYRARQISLWCERGCILLPYPCEEVPWLLDLETDLAGFPAIQYKDVIDTLSMGGLYLEHLLAEGWQARIRAKQQQENI